MIQMTLAEFRSEAVAVDNLADALPEQSIESAAGGRLYRGGLYIEDATGWGTYQEDPTSGRWYLLLGNQEWQTDDLESLECRLYRYAVAEGFIAEPAAPVALTSYQRNVIRYALTFYGDSHKSVLRPSDHDDIRGILDLIKSTEAGSCGG